MVLGNVILADTGQVVDISIDNGTITKVSDAMIDSDDPLRLYFEDSTIFPGLINSHDHLDFNLFPQLGSRIYNNYTEWGADIHKIFKHEIAEVTAIPQHLRIAWGVYKNLLCGVTTVVNHGEEIVVDNPLINIFERTHDLHSAAFEKNWRLKLNNPLKRKLPVVIHTGEGTDKQAEKEIDSLISWNKLGRELIGIHAVAMTKEQAPFFKAIVWCPLSNYFLLDKTAVIQKLKPFTNVLFGTDSTLTSDWNIWAHIKMARETRMLTDAELYSSLTKTAASTWKTNNGEIKPGTQADLVIAKARSDKGSYDAFYATQPSNIQLVVYDGQIRLFDKELLPKLANHLKGKLFSLIKINEAYKYVAGDIGELVADIHSYLPQFVFPFTFIQKQVF
jgi:cytosine/adenosine deaminase-related metal-dependent hydrolase